ncbi:hypothetical protein [Parafilimonas sp.]|uniref:hypothetical protein n=1 Tax=Parafilimonas sp. TaxID=1969739 RepID=UPI0039E385D9
MLKKNGDCIFCCDNDDVIANAVKQSDWLWFDVVIVCDDCNLTLLTSSGSLLLQDSGCFVPCNNVEVRCHEILPYKGVTQQCLIEASTAGNIKIFFILFMA